MGTFTHREIDLQTAAFRANTTGQSSEAFGSQLSALWVHGGHYSMGDPAMMEARLRAMDQTMLGSLRQGMTADQLIDELVSVSKDTSKFYFYHMNSNYYKLHASLIGYLTYPNVHLKSPLPLDASEYRPRGKTFSPLNTSSHDIPAAMTFVGQFIDHDLTLNGVNLFDKKGNPTALDQASPYIDLDNIYGPRMDDMDPNMGNREIPMEDGYFRLRRIQGGGYDACRRDAGVFGQHFKPLIGDKRNDDNQIVLQVHILLMRLHNTFRSMYTYAEAKKQTILHWQSVVATEYLPLVCDPQVVSAIAGRLATDPGGLVHKPGNIPAHPDALGMPHEFAIGFRFGHSQLRSRYRLNRQNEFRLFDNLSDGKTDLQGGKCLTHDRIIDWEYFLSTDHDGPAFPSNQIDTQVNQVVFDLPESTIPDQVNLVTNLPFRNLQRSDSVRLCSGEDLVDTYKKAYPSITGLTAQQVEPDATYRPLFMLEVQKFQTPLWYYILREAEVEREARKDGKGHLGQLGSHLVSEIILSGIHYAEHSFLKDVDWKSHIPTRSGDDRKIKLVDIAQFVAAKDVTAPACPAGSVC